MNSGKITSAGDLPDEIWMKILEGGIKKSTLICTDLCSLSMSSKHFNTLSNDDRVWKTLLVQRFPRESTPSHSSSSSSSTNKLRYKFIVVKCIALIAQKEFHLQYLDRRSRRIRRETELLDFETVPDLFIREMRRTTCRLKRDVVKLDRSFTESELAIMRAKIAFRNGGADGTDTIGFRNDAGAGSN